MKTMIATMVTALGMILPASALAADDHATHGAMHGAATTAPSMAEGVVKRLDKSSGKVTLAHGPLANLGMPAMTMAFQVKDKAWLSQLRDGDRVRFSADNLNGNLTIVTLERPK